MKRILAFIFALFASAWFAPASAGIFNACQGGNVCTLTPARVPFGQASTVTIRWRMDVDFTGLPPIPLGGPVPVTSAQATISDGVSTLATINKSLAFTAPNGGSGSGIVTETVLIPRHVTEQAVRAGSATLFYTRSFTDTQAAGSGTVAITIASSSGGALSIARLSLAFDDGAPVRLVSRGDALRAAIAIGFNGSGLLRGVWEVAGPTSTAGQAVFRPLSTIQQYFAGTSPRTLSSPRLPTDAGGLYLLRFRITEPATALEAPVIRYFVGTGEPGERAPALPVTLLGPSNGAYLVRDTEFAWQPVRGARVYQLEIYARPRAPEDALPNLGGDSAASAEPRLPGTAPITGVLVAGDRTRAKLSSTARVHLEAGQVLLWRVRALDGNGTVVGESAVREMRMP